MSKVGVISKGQVVGYIVDPIFDMWYLDGDWQPLDTIEASEFLEKARNLVPREVARNPLKALRILLDIPDNESINHAIVYGISDRGLAIRRVVTEESIDWLVKNVPE